MDDYIKSIKAHLYDRATSPLFGTFTISWVLWNLKTIIVLVSTMDPEKKFTFISEHIYSTPLSVGLYGALYPLLSTLAFIFLYPYVAKPVYKFTLKQKRELQNLKKSVEEETLLSVADSLKLRREFLSREREFEKVLGAKDEEVQRLKQVITSMEEEKQQYDVHKRLLEPKPREQNLTQSQQQILVRVASTDGNDKPYPHVRLIEEFGKTENDRIRVRHDIDVLMGESLIHANTIGPGTLVYRLTPGGRRLAVSILDEAATSDRTNRHPLTTEDA
jgi:hypothetical protein